MPDVLQAKLDNKKLVFSISVVRMDEMLAL